MSKSMADTSNILTNGVIFFTLKHTDLHTVRGRSTKKMACVMSMYFETGRSADSKWQKNQNDLADLAKVSPGSYQKSNEFSVNRKCRQNVPTDDRRTLLIKTRCVVFKL